MLFSGRDHNVGILYNLKIVDQEILLLRSTAHEHFIHTTGLVVADFSVISSQYRDRVYSIFSLQTK